MISNNKSQRIHNPQTLLEFWEQVHGELKPKWRAKFLQHSAVKAILTFNSDQIKVAIRRGVKLNDVLGDLKDQAKRKEEFDRKRVHLFIPADPRSSGARHGAVMGSSGSRESSEDMSAMRV